MNKHQLSFVSIFFLFSSFHLNGQTEWIVQLKPGKVEADLLAGWSQISYRHQSAILVRSIGPRFQIYTLTSTLALDKTTILKNPSIALAEINQAVEIRLTPNDPLISQQWHFDNIQAPKAWDVVKGGLTFNNDTVVIGVIDFGFRTSHEDLKNRIWRNKAEVPGNGLDDDGNGYEDDVWGLSLRFNNGVHPPDTAASGNLRNHGTSVAGLIGGESNNDKGIAGMMWSVKLMLGSLTEKGLISELIEQFNYMLDQRIKYNESNGQQGAYVVAINYSGGVRFAFAEDYPIWCNMYDQMGAAGILNCGSTVNALVDVDDEGDMPSTCPSDFLVTVTNTGKDNKKVTVAGYGVKHIDLGAPGNFIHTTHSSADNSYFSFDGTSAAAPVVAGAIGLIYSYPCKEWADYQKVNPTDAARLAKRALLAGVDKNSDLTGKTVSGGRLNIARSIDSLKSYACNGTIIALQDEIRINSIRPNPAISYLNIILESARTHPYTIEILDPVGRVLYRQEKVQINGQFQLVLPELYDGLYILKLTQNNAQASKLFVIRS